MGKLDIFMDTPFVDTPFPFWSWSICDSENYMENGLRILLLDNAI